MCVCVCVCVWSVHEHRGLVLSADLLPAQYIPMAHTPTTHNGHTPQGKRDERQERLITQKRMRCPRASARASTRASTSASARVSARPDGSPDGRMCVWLWLCMRGCVDVGSDGSSDMTPDHVQ